MIEFFFKRKEIVVDFFTCDIAAHKFAPIQTSIKSMPAWFKNTPKSFKHPEEHVKYVNTGTIKNCYGLTEYFKRSFTVPMWSDLVIDVSTETYGYYFAGGYMTDIASHPAEATNNTFNNDFHHLKLLPPWLCQSKEDLNLLFIEPFWNHIVCPELVSNLFIQHGVVNCKYIPSVNINLFLRKENYRLELAHKMPIVHLVPLTDRKVKVTNHLVGEKEFLSLNKILPPVFLNKYKKGTL
jgi:hypothetical protein